MSHNGKTVIETADFCSIYPITISQSTLEGAQSGQSFVQIPNGTSQGNYSWLSWRGENDAKTIESSLIPPGNSDRFIEPGDASDTKLQIEDWVQGSPGVKNSKGIRTRMDNLLGKDIIVPIWDTQRKQGSQRDYHVTNFAVITLDDYQLSGKGYISFTFKNHTSCYNKPPLIVSTPPVITPEKSIYTYQVEVEDPNINDIHTFTFDKSPTSMTVSENGGLIEWLPTDDYLQSTPEFNQQCYVVSSGSVGIYEEGDIPDSTIYIAPLFQRVKDAIETAGDYTARESVAWDQQNQCLGCHIQSQSLLGLQASKEKAEIDEVAAEYLLEGLLTSQQSDGTIRRSHPEHSKTQTAFALWALTFVPDSERTFAVRGAALDYFWGVRQSSGEHTYWTDDYDTGWIRWTESITAVITQAAAHFISEAQSKDNLTSAQQQTVNNYLGIFPNINKYMLDGATDNNNENLIHAFRQIAIGELRPHISDPAQQIRMAGALSDINSLLRNRQLADGGWSRYASGSSSDPLTSAWVGLALDQLSPPSTDPVITHNIEYLLNAQSANGTWVTNSGLFTTHLATTSLVMAYLPIALEHLGNPDVSVRHIIYKQTDEQNVTLNATVLNRGLSDITVSIMVKFYNGSAEQGELLGTAVLEEGLPSNSETQISINTTIAAVTQDVTVVIDVSPETPECEVSNNTAKAALITTRVTDLGGLYDTQTWLLNVDDVNEAPEITSTPELTLEGGQVFNYQLTITDNDNGDSHFFSILNGPEGLYIDPRTGQFSSSPELLVPGTYEVTVLVEDLRGLTTTQTFTLTVNENLPPQVISPAIERFTENQTYSYAVQAQDPNQGDVLVYGFEYAPGSIQMDATSGQINGSADVRWVDPLTSENRWCEAPPRVLDASLEPVEKWRRDPNSAPLSNYNQVMHAPIVTPLMDTNGNGKADSGDDKAIIFHSYAGRNYQADGVLRAVSAKDGTHLWSVTDTAYRTVPAGSLAVADIDHDGFIEIVAPRAGGGIIVFEHTGEFKWQAGVSHTVRWGGASIADLNHDGVPEIIVGRTVFDNMGNLLWIGSASIGSNLYGPISFAADIDLDGYQEVIAGGAVYSHDGQLLFNRGEGLAAVGNFDEDDFSEIVRVYSGRVYLYDHDGVERWRVAIPGGGRGGAPTVADMTGDGIPEIGVAGASQYVVFDHQGNILWSSATYDSSAVTGSSVFDFNGDGRAEVVYADERNLRIYDGPTGEIKYQIPNTSGTTYELPVIADVDNDSHAEIVIISNNLFSGSYAGIRVFEGRDDNWAPTRGIWNQHAYSINNINDDGSVPNNPEPSWQTHNTFRLNTFLDRSALAQADIIVSELRLNNDQITAIITNRGIAPVTGQIRVDFYHEHTWTGDATLGEVTLPSLAAGESQTISLAVDSDSLTQTVRAEVTLETGSECATDNNTTRAAIIEIGVYDPAGLFDQQKYLLSGENVNDAPSITSGNISNAVEGIAHAFQVTIEDPDRGDAVRYALQGATEGIRIDEITGKITADNVAAGIYLFTITVTDLAGASDTQQHALIISVPDNYPPVFTSQPSLQILADDVYQYQPQASDQDGDAIVFLLSQSPDGMTIDSVSGLIQWSTFISDVGSYNIKITALDSNGAGDKQSYVLEVTDPFIGNIAPVITSVPTGVVYVGVNFVYPVIATDADNDNLSYRLENAAAGMSITADGDFNWLPSQQQVGQAFKVDIIVEDGRGGSATQILTLPVNENANNPPAITSTPEIQALAGELYSYNIQTQDADGDAVTLTLEQAPNGMGLTGNTISWTPASGQAGEVHGVTLRATDARGAMSTQSYGIAVNQAVANNTLPEILSIPASPAIVGALYSYQVVAVDVEDNPLAYSISSAIPPGMVLDQNGLLSWTPTESQVGNYAISVTVSDGIAFTTQSYTLAVVLPSANNIPSISSLPPTEASLQNSYVYQLVATDVDNDPLSYGLLTSPTGMTVDATTGLISWSPDATQLGWHEVQVYAEDDKGAKALQSYSIAVFEQTLPLTADILLSSAGIAPGDSLTITVLTSGGLGEINTSLTVDGQPVTLDGLGQVTIIAPSTTGAHTIEVFVTDDNGSITETSHYYVIDTSDTTPPVVTLHGPAFGSVHTAPSDVIASVFDANLADYTLYLSPAGKQQWQTIASGNANVDNAPVGIFDPTMLMNGQYDLLLQATDINNQTSVTSAVVSVEGDLKVGHFSITFEDVNIPVAGMPIVVTRTYDSRQRHNDLDFGFGWSVDYQNMRIHESRKLGLSWSLNQYSTDGLVNYCVEPNGDPIVSITLPDGRIEKFKAVANPHCQLFVPATDVNIEFEAIDSSTGATTSTLTQSSYGQVRLVSGNLVYLLDQGNDVDPNLYQLTTVDGFVFDLNEGFTITSITTPTGHSLTYTDQGITHSGGKGVVFTRDAANRITAITLPDGNAIRYEYDAQGNLLKHFDELNQPTSFTYDTSHALLDIIDANGASVTRNEYDETGRLIAQIDGDGNRIEFTHNIDARTEIIRNRRGFTQVFSYDDQGNVLTETNALGETITRTYDTQQNVLSESDGLGNTTAWTYDNKRNKLTETNALGHISSYTYNALNKQLTETDDDNNALITNTYTTTGDIKQSTNAIGQITNFAYDPVSQQVSGISDALGNIAQVTYASDYPVTTTDSNGAVTTLVNDDMGRKLSETTTRTLADSTQQSLTTSYVYDAKGRLIKTTGPQNDVTQSEYDIFDKEIASIDALQRRTEFEYDIRGNLLATRYPDSTSEINEYDAENNLIRSLDRSGNETLKEYDAANRLTKTTFADTSFTINEYDLAGRLTASIDTLNHRTEYTYDKAGRQTQVKDAQGNITQYAYDKHGNRIQMIDANTQVTTFEYNLEDRLIKTIFPDSSFSQTAYDERGRKISETDQAGVTTSYAYDGAGRLTKVIDVLNQETSYTYDEQDNKLTQTDAEARTTSWTYDEVGRVLTRTLPMGQVESFTYDAVGNVLTRTDFNGQMTSYVYDNNNRVTSITYDDASIESFTYDNNGNRLSATGPQGSWSYQYDVFNRLIQETKPTGEVLNYRYDSEGNKIQLKVTYLDATSRIENLTYDVLNRLETVTDASLGVTSYGYDNNGNRASVTNANGTSTVYTYDTLNRLTKVSHYNTTGGLINEFTYTLGAAGRRTQIAESNGRVTGYTYDELYRLLTETITDATNGNYSAQYTYDKVGNRTYSTINGVQTQYIYDANDHLEQQGGTTYTYDDNGSTLTETLDLNTKTFSYNAKNQMVGSDQAGVVSSYGYNIDGIRNQKAEAGISTDFLVDLNRDYAQVVTETTPTEEINYTYGDDLVSQSRNGSLSYYLYDGLGSTRALTNDVGTVTDTYNYEAFGDTLNKTGTTDNNYLFTGEQYDSNLDNYYLRARYYDQNIGRFTQQDTWKGDSSDPVTLHKYLYANVDPINNIDPSGNISIGSVMAGVTATARLAAVSAFSIIRSTSAASKKFAGSIPVHFGRLMSITRSYGYKVKRKHMPDAKGKYNKFAKEVNPNKIIREGLKTKKAKIKVNSNDSWELIADLGKAIGTKGQTKIKIVFSNWGKIITTYPVK